MSFLWKIGGEAGYGVMTTGLSISKVATRSGYHIWDYSEYPSLIRGGHNTYEVHISEEVVRSSKSPVDLLVCLNKETYTLHQGRLHDKSVTVYDPDIFTPEGLKGKAVAIPVKKILMEQRALSVMGNMLTFGASLALMGADSAIYEAMIRETFAKKGDEVIEANINMVNMGTKIVLEQFADCVQPILTKKEPNHALVIAANEMFGLASVAADLRFYCSYPMTPASSVLTYLSAVAESCNMVVKQAEDEISVVNAVLGASFGGVRAACGTSGGGFALMVESISYAGVAEIPIVIFLSQRPGPATGVPTWTQQGDLLFAVHAGHGDFQKIVIAPGDSEEMAELTLRAYDLADVYQVPVIVMSDKVLSESHQDVSKSWFDSLTNAYKPNRGKIITEYVGEEGSYLRYQITEDGISPLLVPGQKGEFYQANSYEHMEDSHTTEDMEVIKAQVDKRDRKEKLYLEKDFALPKVFGNPDEASTIFVSWGGSKGVILDSMEDLKKDGIKTAYIHFTSMYPLNTDKLKPLFPEGKNYLLVENNATAQFGRLLRQQTGIDVLKDTFLKYDGKPIFKEEIIEKLTIKS